MYSKEPFNIMSCDLKNTYIQETKKKKENNINGEYIGWFDFFFV